MVAGLLAHYGGIDETAIIWMPIVMVIGLYFIFRGGDPKQDEPPRKEEEKQP
jgi:hypothetical protein